MNKYLKPLAFVLFLMLLFPCFSFAGEYYPNQMLDDMIRLDKWNNSNFTVEQNGNIYKVTKKINHIKFADDLTDTFTKVNDKYSGCWPDASRHRHYKAHQVISIHPSAPTLKLPVRATKSDN